MQPNGREVATRVKHIVVQWDYGKEINITLEDALMSLESLRFMLGGAIKYPDTTAPVVVHHTEEVVCGDNGVMPLPKDHLTGETLTPTATQGHPIRLINLTTGTRTQLVYDGAIITMDGTKAISFKNPKMIGDSPVVSAKGDHIRIFWDEVLQNNNGTETAIEVTISPDTLDKPGEVSIIKVTNCWKLLLNSLRDNQQLRSA